MSAGSPRPSSLLSSPTHGTFPRSNSFSSPGGKAPSFEDDYSSSLVIYELGVINFKTAENQAYVSLELGLAGTNIIQNTVIIKPEAGTVYHTPDGSPVTSPIRIQSQDDPLPAEPGMALTQLLTRIINQILGSLLFGSPWHLEIQMTSDGEPQCNLVPTNLSTGDDLDISVQALTGYVALGKLGIARRVIGFITEYYKYGKLSEYIFSDSISLSSILGRKRRRKISLLQKAKWALQMTTVVIDLHWVAGISLSDSGGGFGLERFYVDQYLLLCLRGFGKGAEPKILSPWRFPPESQELLNIFQEWKSIPNALEVVETYSLGVMLWMMLEQVPAELLDITGGVEVRWSEEMNIPDTWRNRVEMCVREHPEERVRLDEVRALCTQEKEGATNGGWMDGWSVSDLNSPNPELHDHVLSLAFQRGELYGLLSILATSDGYTLAVKTSTIVPASVDQLWIVDFDASNHIVNQQEDLLTYKVLNPSRRIYFKDNNLV
ncbi:hypothetical protein B9Z19DRAFT_1131464 [Tuber borchii]|uniref:Protein kinase domain-containing protein n=1 Tax=Tuber borchii TaxID=42251 RepID=A0A2T6ZIR7_TUBBO|nr:hypothetical protein B9Z19DRAFT_1131464 [Tuber borchii]